MEVKITPSMIADWQSPDGWSDFNGRITDGENVFIKLRDDSSYAIVRLVDGVPTYVAVMADRAILANPSDRLREYSPVWVGAGEEHFNLMLEVIDFKIKEAAMPPPEFSLEEIELADEIIKRG